MLNALIKVKNAQAVKQESAKVPFSKMTLAILEILKKYHYIESVAEKGVSKKDIKDIEVKLRYKDNGGAIHGIKILSKPSRRLYAGYKEIKPVKQGYGVLVLSTSKGIMDGKTAKKMKLGGQLLFEIW